MAQGQDNEIEVGVRCFFFLCSVVKEELAEDEALLPHNNGRVVCWVSVCVGVCVCVCRCGHVHVCEWVGQSVDALCYAKSSLLC